MMNWPREVVSVTSKPEGVTISAGGKRQGKHRRPTGLAFLTDFALRRLLVSDDQPLL
jgi:hypothetical protein